LSVVPIFFVFFFPRIFSCIQFIILFFFCAC
jgi:hypothetical protein